MLPYTLAAVYMYRSGEQEATWKLQLSSQGSVITVLNALCSLNQRENTEMHDSWTCLNVEKGPGIISDVVRNVLKAAACDLHLRKWDEMRIENDLVSGVIKTEWNTHVVGGRSGVLFRAQVDCEDGTDYQINFLFHEEDLERGADIIRQMKEQEGGGWAVAPARIPCPELYRFYDLRGPSRRLH